VNFSLIPAKILAIILVLGGYDHEVTSEGLFDIKDLFDQKIGLDEFSSLLELDIKYLVFIDEYKY
jgi:hypothetical protein